MAPQGSAHLQRPDADSAQPTQGRAYETIEVPKSSPIGFVNAFFAVVTGFALIWHIWWMAGLGLIGAFLTLIAFAFRDQEEVEIPAVQVAQFEARRQAEVTP